LLFIRLYASGLSRILAGFIPVLYLISTGFPAGEDIEAYASRLFTALQNAGFGFGPRISVELAGSNRTASRRTGTIREGPDG
jgi:hypothetical protein